MGFIKKLTGLFHDPNYIPLWGIVFIISFICAFYLSGTSASANGLDPAFHLVLEYATKHDMQFGKDIVFTYGPLGFLNGEVGFGHCIDARIVFSLFWSTIVAWSVTGLVRRMILPFRYIFLVWFLFYASLGAFEQHVFEANNLGENG